MREAAAEQPYDVVVMGAGRAGHTLPDRARSAGLSVALLEHRPVGDECSYRAGIPCKALLPTPAEWRARRRRSSAYGQRSSRSRTRQLSSTSSQAPGDRAWFVASEIDLVSTYVAGSKAAIEALLHEHQLEVVPSSVMHRITAAADRVNL